MPGPPNTVGRPAEVSAGPASGFPSAGCTPGSHCCPTGYGPGPPRCPLPGLPGWAPLPGAAAPPAGWHRAQIPCPQTGPPPFPAQNSALPRARVNPVPVRPVRLPQAGCAIGGPAPWLHGTLRAGLRTPRGPLPGGRPGSFRHTPPEWPPDPPGAECRECSSSSWSILLTIPAFRQVLLRFVREKAAQLFLSGPLQIVQQAADLPA